MSFWYLKFFNKISKFEYWPVGMYDGNTKQKSIHLECFNNHVYSRFMHFLRFIPFYYFTLTNWTILIEKQLEKKTCWICSGVYRVVQLGIILCCKDINPCTTLYVLTINPSTNLNPPKLSFPTLVHTKGILKLLKTFSVSAPKFSNLNNHLWLLALRWLYSCQNSKSLSSNHQTKARFGILIKFCTTTIKKFLTLDKKFRTVSH